MQAILNNAQLEILKMFSKPMSKKELSDLRKTLTEFLSNKVDNEVDKIWNKKKLSQDKLDKVLNTHVKRKK
jgi:hypothetical protein